MSKTSDQAYDVAIIGGGPGGSTVGTLLRKYDPNIRVLILEREKFPREHIGESQLPAIGAVLYEMGAWEKIEAANFPVKIGATYRWGATKELWDFDFLPPQTFKDEPRPGKYEGQRQLTAFQVERAVYDEILLDHAAEMGCEVREETAVTAVSHDGDRVTGLTLGDGSTVTARWYIDASGHVGILRRSLGIKTYVPTELMNIAIWDYWTDTEWAVTLGNGGTRIQIMSIRDGWIWFIPVGPTRTSIGFVCPAEYYRKRALPPADLYNEALSREPRLPGLLHKATRENKIRTTKDWSFVSDRMAGENWMLVGECAGFADPILSGGMTLTHTGGREAAYSILAIDRNEHDPQWLKTMYQERQERRIRQYIRFADFWYAANGQTQDLHEYTRKIAQANDLDLEPAKAFRWLSLGGFAHEDFLFPGLGGCDLLAIKEVNRMFTRGETPEWELNRYNTFTLNLAGARKDKMPLYHRGKIMKADCYVRKGHWMPRAGLYGLVMDTLQHKSYFMDIANEFERQSKTQSGPLGITPSHYVVQAMSTLETMLLEGWVEGRVDRKKPMVRYSHLRPGTALNIHPNVDPPLLFEEVPSTASGGTGG